MGRTGQADEAGRVHARVDVAGSGEANVATGVSVLDHLIGLLAQYGSFDVALEIAPGEAEAEIAAAGRALGRALEDALRLDGGRGHGSAGVSPPEAPPPRAPRAARRAPGGSQPEVHR